MTDRLPDWALGVELRIRSGMALTGRFLFLAFGLSFVGGFPLSIAMDWHWVGQLVAFLGYGAFFGWAVYWLLEPKKRADLLDFLILSEPVGWATPLLLTGGTILFASSVFGLGTLLLHTAGAIDLHDPACVRDCPLTAGDVAAFYWWHAFETIPLLQINERIGWEEPLQYEGALTGWILVLFYLTTIFPIFQAFRGYWRRRAEVPRVRLRAEPRIGRVGEPIRLSWVVGEPPPGFVYVLEMVRPRKPNGPKEKRAERLSSPLFGTPARSGTFHPDLPGPYRFRARWGKAGMGLSDPSLFTLVVVREAAPSDTSGGSSTPDGGSQTGHH
jgi:hypothetical protein